MGIKAIRERNECNVLKTYLWGGNLNKQKKKTQNVEGNNWPQTERVGWDLTHTGSSVCAFTVCGRVDVWFFFFSCAWENRVFVFLQGRFIISTLKLLLIVGLKSLLAQLERPHSSYQCWDVSLLWTFSKKHLNHFSIWLCTIDTFTSTLKEEMSWDTAVLKTLGTSEHRLLTLHF